MGAPQFDQQLLWGWVWRNEIVSAKLMYPGFCFYFMHSRDITEFLAFHALKGGAGGGGWRMDKQN